MAVSRRNCLILALALCVVALSCVASVEAGPLTRWKQRRATKTGNVTTNAPPPAPANMTIDAPVNQQCIPGVNCPPQAPVPQAGPGGHPIIQQPVTTQPLFRGIPVDAIAPALIPRVAIPQQTVDRAGINTEAARVDRLLSALEQRLGIKPQAAVIGDPKALFNKLPRVHIELRSQEGEVEDEVEIDLKEYILEQLTQ